MSAVKIKERNLAAELKPCPFCGEAENLKCHLVADIVYWVTCGQCSADGPFVNSKKEAVELWNKRAIAKKKSQK